MTREEHGVALRRKDEEIQKLLHANAGLKADFERLKADLESKLSMRVREIEQFK